MANDCPYCNLAIKKGELYCSRHATDMRHLDSGVFFIRTNQFEESDMHVTRLSLNFNLDDTQYYTAGNREFKISPEKYLLINEGQSFKTHAASEFENRMVTVAFKVGMAEQMINALSVSDDSVLEPAYQSASSIGFPEKTYTLDAFVHQQVHKLIQPGKPDDETQQEIEELLLYVLKMQMNIKKDILAINKVKVSTRHELYKRMHWSLEYIHDNYMKDISVEVLAAQACLSVFHFKRLFREIFGQPPYQYLKTLRLERACSLLASEIPVNEICKQVGWKDASSFSRLFKNNYNCTPQEYRKTR